MKTKTAYLPDFILENEEQLREMTTDQIRAFISKHLPSIHLKRFNAESKYRVTNPYTKVRNDVNGTQAAVLDFVVHYDQYQSEEEVLNLLVLQNQLERPSNNAQVFELMQEHSEMLEEWNAARYLIRICWSDLYANQVD